MFEDVFAEITISMGDFLGNYMVYILSVFFFVFILDQIYKATKIKKVKWATYLKFLVYIGFLQCAFFGTRLKVLWSRGYGHTFLGDFANYFYDY